MYTLEKFLNILEEYGFIVKNHSEGIINRCSTIKSKNSSDKSAWFIYKHINNNFFGIYADFKIAETLYYPEKPSLDQRKDLFSLLNHEEDKSFMHHVWQSEFNMSETIQEHAYLSKKQIIVNDIKNIIKIKEDKLIIPLKDFNNPNMLCGLQTIDSHGNKKFRSGTRFKSSFFLFESKNNEEFIICEGFATGYSLWKSLDKPVLCALSAQNIVSVYKSLREKTTKKILIACDNDETGLSIIKKIDDQNVKFYYPSTEKQDFNDVYCERGSAGVKSYFVTNYSNLFQFGAKEFQENWLFNQYIENSTIFFIIGAPGVGKSFIALYIAMCAANNYPFYGQQPKNEGHVLYVCGESFRGVNNRILALKNEYNLSDEKLIITTKPVLFLDSSSINELIENVLTLKNNGITLSMMFIDTLNANFGDGDENKTADATKFITKVRELHLIFPDMAIGIVHHTGHNNPDRARGNSAFFGAADTEFLIKKGIDKREIVIINTKQKNADTCAPLLGLISTNQKAGVFQEKATENISDDNIEQIIKNTQDSINDNNKNNQITSMIKIKSANSDNNQITHEEIINILSIMGINKKHFTTYLKRLLSDSVLMSTTEKNIYLVNIY